MTRLQLCAYSLWSAQRAARQAKSAGRHPDFISACFQIQAIHRHAQAPSLRRVAETTLASLGSLALDYPVDGGAGDRRAARDVAPGTSWAFRDHRPLSVPAPTGPGSDTPPPSAA